MSNYSLTDTLRTLASKLDGVQEVLGRTSSSVWPGTRFPEAVPNMAVVLQRLDTLSAQVEELKRSVDVLRNPPQILPLNPMHGIEVVPKREVVLETNALSFADRLLLNKDAKKALEAEEMGATRDDEYPLGEDSAMDVEAEAEAEAEEEVEEEEEEVEAGPEDDTDAEADAEELEEFEYKGSTYYRDSDNNVFMTDEDGDLVEDPIGVWNAEKGKIMKKA